MIVTFGRLGRGFLLAGLAAAVLALLGYLLLDGTARFVVTLVLGILAVNGLIQGVVWTAVQHRMFGSIGARRRAAAGQPRTATVVSVASTSSRIGNDSIARLGLRIDGAVVERRVRIPFTHAATLRPGTELPVRVDPEGSRAMVVDWSRVP